MVVVVCCCRRRPVTLGRERASSIIPCLLARLGSFKGKGNLVVWEVQVIAISSPITIARFLYGGALFIVNVLFWLVTMKS